MPCRRSSLVRSSLTRPVHEVESKIGRRQRVARSERDDLYPTVIEKRRRIDQECVGLLLQETREGCINFPISAGGKGFDLQS